MAGLILASQSPRRKELLKLISDTFESISSDVDETVFEDLPPEELVIELAKRKVRAVAKDHPNAYVIGADTIVVLNNKIYGKPQSKSEAQAMLQELSGKTHSVYTGTVIRKGNSEESFCEKTNVTFWELSDADIEEYIATGEPFDKAGAYGIQGYGATLVKKIDGDYFSVVGLPVAKLKRTLQNMGYHSENLQ